MIQRIQSLYLLVSVIISAVIFFLPLGYLGDQNTLEYTVCGFFYIESGELLSFNIILSSILSLTLLLQLISIFLFRKRSLQAMLVQITLITLLIFVVIALLHQDMFPVIHESITTDKGISFNWNVALIFIPWIFSYMALKGIKKDEALIRSVNRMR